LCEFLGVVLCRGLAFCDVTVSIETNYNNVPHGRFQRYLVLVLLIKL